MALDVEGRIGLGITEALRLAQAFLERDTLLLHAREDVIAGAVEDAVDARKGVAVEAFAQRFHDRDTAGDRSLEIECDAMALGERRKLVTVARQQRFVRRHHRLAGGKRGFDRALGRVACSADQFDEGLDGRIGGKLDRIGDPARFFQIDHTLLAARARADGDHLDRAAATRHELLALTLQKLDHGRADSAQSGKTDFQRLDHKRRQPGTSLTSVANEGWSDGRLTSRRQGYDVVQHFRPCFKKAPDVACGLPNTLLVLD